MFSPSRRVRGLGVLFALIGSTSCDENRPALPKPTAPCPTFTDGTVTFTVGGEQRQVRLYVDPTRARTQDGPLVLYYYGISNAVNDTGLDNSPLQVTRFLTQATIDAIVAEGGVVAVPVGRSGSIPWMLPTAAAPDSPDLAVADEIVACAKTTVGIDSRRIHVSGFTSGAYFASALSFARSSYVASAAVDMGGFNDASQPTYQNPRNEFAALVMRFPSIDFRFLTDATLGYRDRLLADGHFVVDCNNDFSYSVQPTPAYGPSIARFFSDHPFGRPSPYQAGLPSDFGAVALQHCVAKPGGALRIDQNQSYYFYDDTISGTELAHSFTITNTKDRPATLGPITDQGLDLVSGAFHVTGGTCTTGKVLTAKGGMCTLEVTFQPTTVNQFQDTLRLPFTWSGDPTVQRSTLSLFGNGSQPSQ